MKNNYLILIFLCIILIIVDISLISFSQSKENVTPPNVANKTMENGAVTNIWVTKERLDILRENNIKYLFVDVGETGIDGKIKTPSEYIGNFLNFIHSYEYKNNYSFVMLPYSEINSNIVSISSEEFKTNFVRDYRNLYNRGFDGILVDIEPVKYNQRPDFIEILEALNEDMPKKAIISVYSGFLGSNENEWEWDMGFYNFVCRNSDIITIPGYDTGLKTKAEYDSFMQNALRKISGKDWNCSFMMGIPTHKYAPETSANALHVYLTETKNKDTPFIGKVIFADWTANQNDWENLRTIK